MWTTATGSGPASTTITINPQLTIDHPTEPTVDARAGKPVSITVPDRTAISMGALTGYWRLLKDFPDRLDLQQLDTAHEGPAVPATELEAAVGAFYRLR
jgi:hypothetical protein